MLMNLRQQRCCRLPVVCCMLSVACCLLPVACCLLPVVCCLLHVACCLLPDFLLSLRFSFLSFPFCASFFPSLLSSVFLFSCPAAVDKRVATQERVKRQLFLGLTNEGLAREARVLAQTDYDDHFRRNPRVVRGPSSRRAAVLPSTWGNQLETDARGVAAATQSLRAHADVAARAAAQTRCVSHVLSHY